MKGLLTGSGRPAVGHAAIDAALSAGAVAAAHTMVSLGVIEKPNATDAGLAIEDIANRVQEGDLSDLELILVGQAVALSTMGMDMIARARKTGTTDAINTLAAAGMRAIAHSRAAIDSLVNLRNPRQVAFVKQANINNGGQQQVNNGNGVQPSRTPAHEATAPNELFLEANASPTLEPRAARRAGRCDQTLEAVEVGNRTAKRGGQGHGRA